MTLVRGLPSAAPVEAHPSAGASLYASDGKQEFRELLLSIATLEQLRTFGTFFGTGIDSRLMSEAGLDVVAAELSRAKHEMLANDAQTHGYRAHAGRASRLREHFDMFHADFDGGPSPMNFREVRKIAAITDRWLAVTLSMDHLRDESMMGEAAAYTIPAWLTGASGFTLEYLGRYKRNRFGQVMWVAILRRREGKGNWHPVQALQVAYSVGEREYWASRRLYGTALLPHRFSPRNEREKAADHQRYEARRPARSSVDCSVCGRPFVRKGGPQRYCSDDCRIPTRRAQTKAAGRRFYERRLAAVYGTAAEAISKAA